MNGAASQTDGEAFAPEARAPERGVENGIVVGQHGDDDIAVGQIGAVGRRLQPAFGKLAHPVRATDIGEDLTSVGGQIGGHCRAHAA
jgi:hypothetical protein